MKLNEKTMVLVADHVGTMLQSLVELGLIEIATEEDMAASEGEMLAEANNAMENLNELASLGLTVLKTVISMEGLNRDDLDFISYTLESIVNNETKAGSRHNLEDRQGLTLIALSMLDIFNVASSAAGLTLEDKAGMASPLLEELAERLKTVKSVTVEKPEGLSLPEDLPENNALKFLNVEGDELRVGNYIVLYGSPESRDVTGFYTGMPNKNGTRGEYFTENTELESEYTKNGVLGIDWEHGMGFDGLKRDDILGFVDWDSAVKTPKGVWVERVLNRRNKYVKMIEDLVRAGLIGTSTEAVERDVIKSANGELKAWPLRRDSLTVSPMEPRMMKEFGGNVLEALKSLAAVSPAFKEVYEKINEPEESEDAGATEETVERSAEELAEVEALRVESDLLLLELEIG